MGIDHRIKPLALASMLLLASCATVDMDASVSRVNQNYSKFTGNSLGLSMNKEQQASRNKTIEQLMASELDQSAAVQLALLNSPAVQLMLARSWQEQLATAQGARIPNPVFVFERTREGDEVEYARLLSFGLMDLISLPFRQSVARHQLEKSQLQLASEVVGLVSEVRKAWIDAVAAVQRLDYAKMVFESAQTSAELARRMEAVGNFNKITRARQQSFYADAAVALAKAEHHAKSSRENLNRLLGLNAEKAAQLKMPARLPDLPAKPIEARELTQGFSNRLDIKMAQMQWDYSAKSAGLEKALSWTDIEAGIIRDTTLDTDSSTTTVKNGFELALKLPLFDWGGLKRDAADARTLAAASQLQQVSLEAASRLRETYSAYQTTYGIARHYRDEILPLKKTISEENLLRYNGMLIGVFELMADSRDQVAAVMQSIDAQVEFWKADAALQASLVGKPLEVSISAGAAAPSESAAGGH